MTCLKETHHPKLLYTCVLRKKPGLKCHLITADKSEVYYRKGNLSISLLLRELALQQEWLGDFNGVN